MRNWNELSMAEKADVMKLAIEGGVYDLDAIRGGYNEYAKGGKIHIAPSKRGTFTAAASKHGKSVQAFASQVLAHPENYSTAMRKKANFARNAAKWKHGDGGGLFDNIVSSVDEGAYKVSQYLMGLAGHSDGASVKENGEPRESIAQASYLTPRYIQKKKFLQYGYTEAPGDYGLVKKAVGNRKLPVYQKNPDVITRDKLNVIGNTYLWMGKSEDDLVHAGSNPTALYHDDKGNIYQKGWDLNDYGATSGGAYTNYNLLDKIGANILDFVGSPVVVTTGIRPTYNWETKGMSTLANPKSELAPIVDKYLKSKGLVRHTRIHENGTLTGNRVDYIGLPEVVITGKKKKKALGGNLYDGTNKNSQQMQVGRKSPYGGTWLPEVTVNAFEDPMVIIARQNPEYRFVLSQMYEANDSLDNPVITKPQASRLLKVYNLAGSPKLKPLKDGDSRAKIVHPLFGRETIFAGKNVEEGFSDLMAELSHPLQDRFGNNNRIIEHLNPFYSSDDYKGKTRYDFPNKYESETHEDFEPLLNYYIKDNILPGQWYLTDPKEGSLGNDSIVENPGLIQVMDSARVYNKRKQDSKYQYIEPRSERKPRNKIVSFFGDLF